MYKVGLSKAELDEQVFKNTAEAGISAIEVSVAPENIRDIDYKATEKYAKTYGVDLWSYHLPYYDTIFTINPAMPDKEIHKNTVSYFSELIKKGADIGIDKFVIHPSSEPVPTTKDERDIYIKTSMETLDELCEIAAGCGAVLAVEDLPRTCLGNCSDEIKRIISANDKLRVCFDTNHLLNEDNLKFMDAVGDKIITVHISDYDFINERHWLPGEGDVDWKAMYAKFNEINYSGVWMYELGFKGRYIDRERDLIYQDFHKNAQEIFNGEQITVIGKRHKNLGMWGVEE